MIVHKNIRVEGKVQGVWYRNSAKKKALELNLFGYAMNKADQTVYIEVEGEQNSIDSFIKWCQVGPENAIVRNVIVRNGHVMPFLAFEVRRY